MQVDKHSANAQHRLMLENLNRTWSQLAILKLSRAEAVSKAFSAFELIMRSAEEVPGLSEVAKFANGLNGLNLLIRQIIENCPDHDISREDVKALDYNEMSSLLSRLAPATEALAFGSLFAFYQSFASNPNVRIQYFDGYSAIVSVIDKNYFRRESWNALVWEEISTETFRRSEDLLALAPSNIELPVNSIFSWQIYEYPFDDRWRVNNYNIGEWKDVLFNLIERAVRLKPKVTEMRLPVLFLPLDEFPATLASQIGFSERKVRAILEDLTLDPDDRACNLAQTPFVRVGKWLVASSSAFLLRRADVHLIQTWQKRHVATYNKIQTKLASLREEKLVHAFKGFGYEAWHNREYACVVNGKPIKGEIDVLVKDTDNNWLVIEAKNVLPPNPTSESLKAKTDKYQEALKQINRALLALQKCPQAITKKLKPKPKSQTVKTCQGLYVATHTHGISDSESVPSVELIALNYVLERLTRRLTIPQMVDRIRKWSPLKDRPVLAELISSSGFILQFPTAHSANLMDVARNKIESLLAFRRTRDANRIRRGSNKT